LPEPNEEKKDGDNPSQQSEKDKMFLQFQNVVVGEFGVSPTVFLNELNSYTEGQISKAIRVTNRAKQEGKVKNLSGFFIEALRKDFTDAKEEQIKKNQHKEYIQQQLEALQDEQAFKINNKIRDLTVQYPSLTQDAIDSLRINPFFKSYIEKREKILEKTLNVEDFRQDKKLREWVKAKIVELKNQDFEEILKEYDIKVKQLNISKKG
jgi:hypothetical protein